MQDHHLLGSRAVDATGQLHLVFCGHLHRTLHRIKVKKNFFLLSFLNNEIKYLATTQEFQKNALLSTSTLETPSAFF
jgi:hypothetical protein